MAAKKTTAAQRKAQLAKEVAAAKTRKAAAAKTRSVAADSLRAQASTAGSVAAAAPQSWARPEGASTVHAATPTVQDAMAVFGGQAGAPTAAQAAFNALVPPSAGASMAERQAASVASMQARVNLSSEILGAMQQAAAAGYSQVAVGNEVWHVDPGIMAENLRIESEALANNQAIAAGKTVPYPNVGSTNAGRRRE